MGSQPASDSAATFGCLAFVVSPTDRRLLNFLLVAHASLLFVADFVPTAAREQRGWGSEQRRHCDRACRGARGSDSASFRRRGRRAYYVRFAGQPYSIKIKINTCGFLLLISPLFLVVCLFHTAWMLFLQSTSSTCCHQSVGRNSGRQNDFFVKHCMQFSLSVCLHHDIVRGRTPSTFLQR